MGRRAAAFALLLSATPVIAQPEGPPNPRTAYANPSALVYAEMAFNRLAAEKGQWAAFAKTAAKDGVMFVPDAVFAQRWVKQQPVPPAGLRWQVHRVFMACDGSAGVTTGAWQRAAEGKTGWFTTIWRRDEKTGDYRWVLDHGAPLAAPLVAPEDIVAKVAVCPARGRGPRREGPPPPEQGLDPRQPPPVSHDDKSRDGSLRWRWAVAPDKSRIVEVWMAGEGGESAVITDRVAAP